MKIDCKIPVHASQQDIWAVISDYEHMVENIKAITKVDILERPNNNCSLVGLKWTETRTMFGQEATETMWVTDCVVPEYYQTRAESHGAVYISQVYITSSSSEEEDETTTEATSSAKDINNNKNKIQNYVGMKFEGEPQSFCSKVMMMAMGWMFVSETKKCLMNDLEDIKALAEQKASQNEQKASQM